MEFWGVEVKNGEPVTVKIKDGKILHLSQAAMGEVASSAKKDKRVESSCLYLRLLENDNNGNADNANAKKIVLATLSSDRFPQMLMDIVLEKDFELSHNWKNGSVYFVGYYAIPPCESYSEDDLDLVGNEPKAQITNDVPMSEPSGGKQVTIIEPKKDEVSSSDDDDEEDDTSEKEDGSSDDEDLAVDDGENEDDEESDSDGEDEDEEDVSSSDEDQEMPKKAEPSNKKRGASGMKTPLLRKKAKLVTPEKTDGKKAVGGHVATPHPAKKASKVSVESEQGKRAGKATSSTGQEKQTPNSGKSFSCQSCGRQFGSDTALSSHSKAKHPGAA